MPCHPLWVGVTFMAQLAIRKTKPASLDGQSFRNRTKICQAIAHRRLPIGASAPLGAMRTAAIITFSRRLFIVVEDVPPSTFSTSARPRSLRKSTTCGAELCRRSGVWTPGLPRRRAWLRQVRKYPLWGEQKVFSPKDLELERKLVP